MRSHVKKKIRFRNFFNSSRITFTIFELSIEIFPSEITLNYAEFLRIFVGVELTIYRHLTLNKGKMVLHAANNTVRQKKKMFLPRKNGRWILIARGS